MSRHPRRRRSAAQGRARRSEQALQNCRAAPASFHPRGGQTEPRMRRARKSRSCCGTADATNRRQWRRPHPADWMAGKMRARRSAPRARRERPPRPPRNVRQARSNRWSQCRNRIPDCSSNYSFASDGASSPTATGQPIISAAQRCPSLSEPARAACFDADRQMQSTGQQSASTAAPVFLGPTCPSLRIPERAACFAADGVVTTSAASAVVLCSNLSRPARDVCFASDSANVNAQQSNASTTSPVSLIPLIQCPSLPPNQREACFQNGPPLRQ
jgi:hypothetical protein